MTEMMKGDEHSESDTQSHLLSRSFSMYSNFGVRTPFEVMTAWREADQLFIWMQQQWSHSHTFLMDDVFYDQDNVSIDG